MGIPVRFLLIAVATARVASAAPPAPLAGALEHLRDQKSYSWEVINSDPGPVKVEIETRRGKVPLVQQNNAPHVKGSIDRQGDMLIRRTWTDGLQLDTFIAADGSMVTKTPDGWMTNQEILSAMAAESLRDTGMTPRYQWLRRADRPSLRRPDQELLPFLHASGTYDVSGSTYTMQGRIGDDGLPGSPGGDAPDSVEVAVAMNVRNGVIRDYEVRVTGTRPVTRARVKVPVSDQRIVIMTYLPVSRVDVPDEARKKLTATAAPASGRLP